MSTATIMWVIFAIAVALIAWVAKVAFDAEKSTRDRWPGDSDNDQ